MLLAHGEPAGGAPTQDLIPAAIVGALLLAGIVILGFSHRTGKTRALTRLAGLSERVSGFPGWAALPMTIAGSALIVAVFGFYWDVSLHIDNGRDPGPFANPAHYLIIFGLGGIALAGILSILLGGRGATSVRLADGWRAPLGGLMLALCGGIAVLGFPLDDVWHRLFGQDVTLWSPTHLQMVGGAALATLALWILHVEALREPPNRRRAERTTRIAEPLIAGAFLVGLSALHAEFDFSVPQFRLLYHPIILMLSAGTALVAARIRLGPWGAIKAVAFFIALRASLSLLVGPILGQTTLHFPLYLVEALAVEVVALWVPTSRAARFGALSGLAIGTFGLAGEWAWSHLWMTMEWRASLLPEGLIFGIAAGVVGGCLGALIGTSLRGERATRAGMSGRFVAATVAGVVFLLAYPFPTNADLGRSATISLKEVDGPYGRSAFVEAVVTPDDEGTGADWFNVTAWQGGGSVVSDLEPVGPATYRTREPIPIHGDWKALIRLAQGSSIVAVPVYLPEDPAIPAPAVPAEETSTRDFILDKEILLREAKDDVAPALTYTASGAMGAIALLWAASLGWALARLGGSPARQRRPAAVTAPS